MLGQQLLEDQMRIFQERLGITILLTPCEMAELYGHCAKWLIR